MSFSICFKFFLTILLFKITSLNILGKQLGILYPLIFFQKLSHVPIVYVFLNYISTPNIFKNDLTYHLKTCKINHLLFLE
jgi:hypothetical protein